KKEEVSEKPQRESSEQKSEDILKEEGGQKMEKEKEVEKQQLSIEDIETFLKIIQNYVSESQDIGRRAMQLKASIKEGKIPEDNIKQNMIKMAVTSIDESIKNNNERTEELAKYLNKIT
ncbi:MAG: hypothetical protein ACQESP_03795, partial [Candidatus Muiribacteriota bacterium]